MDSNFFRKVNRLTGWMIFIVSALVYFLTLEPTVSFWDCGEFILSAFRLQVGHPPGAPFFLIAGRVFSLFSFGEPARAAMMINMMSALASAFAVMFLYFTIVHLVGKTVIHSQCLAGWKDALPVTGAGAIGALAYAFSDTFWFSAVEGEVYASSSLFTALVFWLILKWENEADDTSSGRWLVLIAYLMGLSVGVHLLNLLVLPAIVIVYYFRKYEYTPGGLLKAFILSGILLAILVFILLPYTVKAAGWFELFFVNSIGLPYNSGLYIYLIFLVFVLVWGIRYSVRRKLVVMNYIFTFLTVIMIGYSSIAMIMIRANARPPMNQNNPSDLFSMIYYVNREQYGSTPLLKGNYYSAPVVDAGSDIAGYNKIDGKYKPYTRPDYKFDERFTTIFPRMYSSDSRHVREYEYWGEIKGRKVRVGSGERARQAVLPSFSENLRFFFRYQLGYMYWRYFMWNFAGRQNDIQGNGNVLHGNWISGIPFIDNPRLGDQELLPGRLNDNPGRNRYYMLPLIFGLAGIVWQYRRNKKGLWIVATFFIMTGVAIVVYLNQYPLQPRERDYAYAGSFYAFSIWIGMGYYLLYELLRKAVPRISFLISFIVSLLLVPVLMISQNWDDHDRSGRYTARDIGANYLNSCDDNAILFTYGDNDSFPVWYAQDVEGIRTDVRVANISYLGAGWYIDMMMQKAWDSDPLPFTLAAEKYIPGERDQLPVVEQITRPVDIEDILRFVDMDEREAKIDFTGRGDYFNYLPVKSILIPVDTLKVINNGTVSPSDTFRLTDRIIWNYPGRELYKSDLAIMDIIGTNKWERPLYYATTVPSSNYNGLDSFFRMEGLSYRLVPLKPVKQLAENPEVNTEKMYNNLMNRFKWGNAADPDVYLDEINRRMFGNFRRMFGLLALDLAENGDIVRAREVIERCEEVIPSAKVPYGYYSVSLLEACFASGMDHLAMGMASALLDESNSYLAYISGIDTLRRYGLDLVLAMNMEAMRGTYNVALKYQRNDLISEIEPLLDEYYNAFYLPR